MICGQTKVLKKILIKNQNFKNNNNLKFKNLHILIPTEI